MLEDLRVGDLVEVVDDGAVSFWPWVNWEGTPWLGLRGIVLAVERPNHVWIDLPNGPETPKTTWSTHSLRLVRRYTDTVLEVLGAEYFE